MSLRGESSAYYAYGRACVEARKSMRAKLRVVKERLKKEYAEATAQANKERIEEVAPFRAAWLKEYDERHHITKEIKEDGR